MRATGLATASGRSDASARREHSLLVCPGGRVERLSGWLLAEQIDALTNQLGLGHSQIRRAALEELLLAGINVHLLPDHHAHSSEYTSRVHRDYTLACPVTGLPDRATSPVILGRSLQYGQADQI